MVRRRVAGTAAAASWIFRGGADNAGERRARATVGKGRRRRARVGAGVVARLAARSRLRVDGFALAAGAGAGDVEAQAVQRLRRALLSSVDASPSAAL
mmetsp:Transcript_17033/g.53155  ORF Transcript_17033/g.53155 Transcript_17033/m.53155 type:complete len:98 (-) Transcript_17033:705-998(-)